MDTKTILIPIFDSFVARNILRTGVITTLSNAGFRTIIIPPKGKEDYYEKEYGNNTVIIARGPFWQHSRLEFFFTGLFLQSIPTNFMRVRQVDWYWNKGKYVAYVVVSILRMLGQFRAWQWFLRTVINRLEPMPAYLVAVMDKYKPDIVFAPTMIPREEIALMRIARARRVKTVGMFKSWDNPTSKAFLRVFPDCIICHTDHVRNEAVHLYGYPKERLIVTGVPQFDRYRDSTFLEPRSEFFSALSLDPQKKLILFAPAGDWMSATDTDVLASILDAIDAGIIQNTQVLVRLHPAYTSKTESLSGRKHLVIERPGIHLTSNLKDVEIDEREMQHLASSIAYSDVLINTASTLTIESAIYDTPVVLIGFDGNEHRPYWRSVRRYYDREHYVNVIQTNAAYFAKSSKELVAAIQAYLDDPKLGALERAALVAQQCGVMDGKAGERVGRAIISTLS